MTNFERLFEEQMKDSHFAKAYHEARVERVIIELLESLKERIARDEPKESLLQMIDSFQNRLHTTG